MLSTAEAVLSVLRGSSACLLFGGCWSAEAALSAPYGLADLSVMIAPVLGQVAYVRTDLSRPLRLSYLNRLRVKMH